ncbi:acetyl-CoA synthetase-like protein [Lentithecium fluviatile CBS 122367]|uniref:Acetyl-CoA synthetase-like protein n=1 Tax=Lentithecium fluviatile CBS 122367 TaxID=1168545 RepID=A0A6G1J2T6_9PLEO|nr:acetyl-CoA synthetase-like protein [Lentithecium fluviatile CBS 122367]
MDTNYFVCTLGQAATLQTGPKPYRTISEFLDHQSKHCGPKPAVGFAIPNLERDWDFEVFSFQDFDQEIRLSGHRLSKAFGLADQAPQTIALLSNSSPEFLFTWLGLVRLGHSVLLIAPQCQPAAILHLCRSCNVSLLVHDAHNSPRAQETIKLQDEHGKTNLVRGLVPAQAVEDTSQPPDPALLPVQRDDTSVAYLHHTSGTSSGLPKPIPQSHRGAIGILPYLPKRIPKATFTTTPLYHGGIADAFRAWTSDSMIWLFPGKDVPITARNILKCLEVARSQSLLGWCPEVKYFSSVPYVLQMMEMDAEGLAALKSMDIVGVGGAALPAKVGDRLVNENVNLISRFGSAECGFLLSSYREFAADKEWQYLRNYNPTKLLGFESRDDRLSELVVNPGWPHIAKANRGNGSFATADLFAKHPSTDNAWLYHSRADSQLTLITGKKFDPAPLEAAIATSDLLDDVLIFGNGRPYPGALLLRSEKSSGFTKEELLETIWPMVKKLNKESQDHARIPQHMLIPAPHQSEVLEKSSKGTIIRKAAEARFAESIKLAYDSEDVKSGESIDDENIAQHLVSLIRSIVPNSAPLADDTDLFSYGVDSIACMQLRNRLRRLTPNYCHELPLSVVEDCGTVRGLRDYILRKRHGEADADHENQERLMWDLVKEYSSFDQQKSASEQRTNGHQLGGNSGEVVVLTGATGALGAHVLDLLRKSDTVSAIYCLVRGTDEHAAKERVSKALEQRGLPGLSIKCKYNDKIRVLQAQLGEHRLGLPANVYEYLAAEACLILHIAWTVNFRVNLGSFAKENIAGLKNLIDLTRANPRAQPARFVYCSSTAAIMNGELDQAGYLREVLSKDPASASPLGYSRSKWVAEQICATAHHQTSLHSRIAIVRVGQLSGDSRTGIWNTKEAWPMMLSTVKLIGSLPNLGDEPLDWLPVDIAAKAFLETACAHSDRVEQVPVYHVLNPHEQPTWHDMLQWLRKKEKFDIVDPAEWVHRLEQSGNTGHSALKLLGLWKESYGGDEARGKSARSRFSVEATQRYVPALKDVQPIDEAYVWKVWDWVQANVR